MGIFIGNTTAVGGTNVKSYPNWMHVVTAEEAGSNDIVLVGVKKSRKSRNLWDIDKIVIPKDAYYSIFPKSQLTKLIEGIKYWITWERSCIGTSASIDQIGSGILTINRNYFTTYVDVSKASYCYIYEGQGKSDDSICTEFMCSTEKLPYEPYGKLVDFIITHTDGTTTELAVATDKARTYEFAEGDVITLANPNKTYCSDIIIGQPFKDSNDFVLSAPSYMSDGEMMEWSQLCVDGLVSDISNWKGNRISLSLENNLLKGTLTNTGAPAAFYGTTIKEFTSNNYYLISCKNIGNRNKGLFRFGFGSQAYQIYNIVNDTPQTTEQTTSAYGATGTVSGTQFYLYFNYSNTLAVDDYLQIHDINLFDLTAMNITSITSSNAFAQLFGYSSIDDMPYFDTSLNGTYMACGGHLYKYNHTPFTFMLNNSKLDGDAVLN